VAPRALLWHVGIGSGWTPEVRNGSFASPVDAIRSRPENSSGETEQWAN
jgi:hypothetical protein